MDDRIESSNLNIEASHLNSDMNLAGGDGLAAVSLTIMRQYYEIIAYNRDNH